MSALALALAAGIVLLGVSFADALPAPAAARDVPGETASAVPSREEYGKQWPRFRGPDGSGVSRCANIPGTWDAQTGKNILWKTAVPLPGNNSPVIWSGQVFLSGANETRRELYCFDMESGKMLWQQAVAPQNTKEPSVMEDTGCAAPSVATDGVRVCAIFATGDVAAFTTAGQHAWTVALGEPENLYGHAASLLTWNSLVLIQFDQGSSEDNKSRLIALDGATGKIKWQVKKRPVGNSWSTPAVYEYKGVSQIVTCGNPWVIAYELTAGQELWRANCLSGDIAPSPVFARDTVYAVNTGAALTAIRAGGSGDVSKTHAAWSAADGLPDICSPLCDGTRVYLLTSQGLLTCYKAASGSKLWEHDFEKPCAASPSLAGATVLVTAADGETILLEAGDTYKELGKAALGEKVHSCMAFADGRILVRGDKHLFAIGEARK